MGLLLAGVVSAGPALAEPEAVDAAFTFRLDTPALQLEPQADGSVGIEIEGFGTRELRPGAPDLPTRTVLVAIPPEATPRLTVRLSGPRTRQALRPRPVARVVPAQAGLGRAELGGEPAALPERSTGDIRRLYEPAPEIYAAAADYPSRVAWLGRTGVLRDQRYVEVHLAPVRYDGRTGGLVLDAALEVTVHFEGAAVGAGQPIEEPLFESVYRKAFANYAQGRRFRLSTEPEGQRLRAPRDRRGPAAASSAAPIRRIKVHRNGVVRLDYDLFSAEAPEFLAADPATWRLTNRGEQLPLRIHQLMGGDASALEPGEWVAFYGQALDDEPETVLNFDNPAGVEDLFEARDFSDVNVYFLTLDVQAQATMSERDATPTGAMPESRFLATARGESDDFYIPLPDELWFWWPFVTESSPTRTEAISLPGLASGTLPAQVRVRVRGSSFCVEVDPDHKTLVSLANDSMQTLVLPGGDPDNVGNQNVGEYDGHTLFVHDFEWTHSGADPQLTDPVHVTLEAANLDIACPSAGGGNVINDVILDFIEIDYQRSFATDSDELTFDWPDGDAEFEISGFDDPAPEVYEITGRLSGGSVVDTVRLTGASVTPDGSTFTVRFHVGNDPALPDGTPRRFVVAGSSAATVPAVADFQPDAISGLMTDPSQADLVVVAHPDLLDSSCSEGGNACSYDVDCGASATDVCEIDTGSALDLLLAHRAAQGISSRVVRVQDVEDEFNHGLPGPTAIKAFLAWVMAGGWESPAPAFVMLLGDGSFHYKGGTATGNYVSTQMMIKESELVGFYSSDNLLAAVVGDDQLVDLVPGRITARTLTEAEDILQKILDYEQAAPAGEWRSTGLFISDRGKNFSGFEATEFEAINDIGAAFLAGTAYTTVKLRYWSDNCVPAGGVCNPELMKTDIKNAVNAIEGDGAAVAQFIGHGNFDLWSDDVIFCANELSPFCLLDDTGLLVNDLRLPWLIVHNCLTGGFHTLSLKTLGEQWLKRSGGGAVAVFAPSGLGFRFLGKDVTEEIWGDVYGPPKERLLAVPVLDSLVRLCGDGSIEGCQFYTLMGDPSTTLALPHVDPASNLAATPSTGLEAFVDLSWDPSATSSVTYDVYRTQDLDKPYAKINESPLAGTSFHDDTVIAAKTYFYHVVAVNGGFESAWSNFNSDCIEPPEEGVPGPDCVQAQPLNLTPPGTPTGLLANDPGTGGRLDVSWSAVPESDVQLYTLHHGPDESLGQTEDFLFSTGWTITGLENGAPYFFAIEATNTSGTKSPLSATVMGVPTLVLGLESPEFIGDLRLARAGEDALLTWGAVTTDIYGKPKSIDHYDVFRGTTSDFVPSPANRIGQPVDPTFTDLGALSAAAPNYHYLVRAVDAEGTVGGLGFELPAGIEDLLLDRSEVAPGNLVLSWSPVTGDVLGNSGPISHYEVYAADEPLSRADIRDGRVGPLLSNVPGNSVEIVPTGLNRYYSVLAVDTKGNKSPF